MRKPLVFEIAVEEIEGYIRDYTHADITDELYNEVKALIEADLESTIEYECMGYIISAIERTKERHGN